MKEKIKNFTKDLGVEYVGFGPVSEYKSPLSPPVESIFPGAKTLVVLTFRELSNCESENMRIAMGGRIDSMEFARTCSYKVTRYIEKEFNAKAMSTPLSYPLNMTPETKFGLIADFSQRHAAIAAGLGSWGRNNLVIHPELGSRAIFLTIITDLELEPEPPFTKDLCTNCNICVENCPAGALDEKGKTDEFKCLSHSQPFGLPANIKFHMKYIDCTPEEKKKMLISREYMSMYQASFIGFEYHCFKCYTLCPIGK